jgi:hypothetical protein
MNGGWEGRAYLIKGKRHKDSVTSHLTFACVIIVLVLVKAKPIVKIPCGCIQSREGGREEGKRRSYLIKGKRNKASVTSHLTFACVIVGLVLVKAHPIVKIP